MRTKFAWLAMAFLVGSAHVAPGQKPAATALAGRVSSDAEGPMEGVLVRAKGEGKTISIAVVTDLILRLDRKTGTVTENMLPPVNANIRHIDVDNSASPVAVWVAEVHQGKIARIEPLE